MASHDKIIERINQLLALANNTSHEAEAETAFRQANKLMIKHSIDEAILNSAAEAAANKRGFKVHQDTYYAFAPYARPKVALATYLGKILRVRVLFAKDLDGDYEMTWYGSKSDIELLGMLFSETAKFGVAELAKIKRLTNYRGQTFTNSFWDAYTYRVYTRAREMYDEVMREAPSGTELVLRNQLEIINEHVAQENPNLRTTQRQTQTDLNGLILGDSSGFKANISLRHRVQA